ncbi:MAG: efflux RND transporter periplasmic adaptor subunit [Terrimicrobiaceae bacterium]
MTHFFRFLLLAALLVGCGKQQATDDRKVRFYQSPMHPWIKSDAPGNCTICGMALVPVFEGENAIETDNKTVLLPESTIQVIQVGTDVVERGTLRRTLRLAGTIDDDAGRHRMVAAFFDGRIEKPFIEQVGEDVRKGQPLAEIYSPELLYVVREYQRARASKDRGVYEVAARRLIQFGLTPDQLEGIAVQSPDRYGIDLLSPITGTVIKRYVNQGQYVKTGDLLFEIGDFSKMWFHATAYESDLPFLHLGQKAQITTPAAPGETFEGVVTLIDPNFDPLTRSTTVRIEVPNPLVRSPRGERRALPHQAFGEASLETETEEGLLVPRSAVLDTGRRVVAYVDKGGGRFERRDLRVAARGDARVLVSSGLAAGERVVTRGSLLLDAESQMKDSGGESALMEQAPTTSPAEAKLPAHPMDNILAVIANAGQALASDDLPAFQAAAEGLHGTLPAFSSPADIQAAVESLEKSRHLTGKNGSLEEARAAYLPLSEAASDLVLALQRERVGAGAFLVFACPMTESAFPGAPAKARWIQNHEPLKNPWFGAAMAECGAPVLLEARP